jgi:beta-glucosidase/6-phospho-beta-glucosidase/beta-galactosidase
VQGSFDFVALNYYTARYVKEHEDGTGEKNRMNELGGELIVDPTWPHAQDIYVYSVPQGLYDLLILMKNKYNNPKIYITENGWSDNGELNDNDRINYIRDHLWSISKAIKDGCNVKAYTVWSLIDNFEWENGYKCHFGLVQINFNSTKKERTLKDSAEYYSNVIANRKI